MFILISAIIPLGECGNSKTQLSGNLRCGSDCPMDMLKLAIGQTAAELYKPPWGNHPTLITKVYLYGISNNPRNAYGKIKVSILDQYKTEKWSDYVILDELGYPTNIGLDVSATSVDGPFYLAVTLVEGEELDWLLYTGPALYESFSSDTTGTLSQIQGRNLDLGPVDVETEDAPLTAKIQVSPEKGPAGTNIITTILVTNTGTVPCTVDVIGNGYLPSGSYYHIEKLEPGQTNTKEIAQAIPDDVNIGDVLTGKIDVYASGFIENDKWTYGEPVYNYQCEGCAECSFKVEQPEPVLRLSHDVLPYSDILPGNEITFYIAASNDGSTALDRLMISHTLPAGISYESSVGTSLEPQHQTNSDGTTTLIWSDLGSVGPHDTLSIQFKAKISENAPSGYLSNNVEATAYAGNNPFNAYDEFSVYVKEPTLDIWADITADPNPAAPGEETTFTITVTNKGEAAFEPVKVENTLPVGMSFISSKVQPQMVPTQDGMILTWNDIGRIEPGKSSSISFKAKIDETASKGTLRNEAKVEGSARGNTRSVMAQLDYNIDLYPDLSISVSIEPLQICKQESGDAVSYEMETKIFNKGTSDANDVTIEFSSENENSNNDLIKYYDSTGNEIKKMDHLSISRSNPSRITVYFNVQNGQILDQDIKITLSVMNKKFVTLKHIEINAKYLNGFPCYNSYAGDENTLCGPISSACVLGYWDIHDYNGKKFNNIIDENYGISNLIGDLRVTEGYIPGFGTQPFMLPFGIKAVCLNRGYDFDTQMKRGSNNFEIIKEEIDGGRPCIFSSIAVGGYSHDYPTLGYIEQRIDEENSEKIIAVCLDVTKGCQSDQYADFDLSHNPNDYVITVTPIGILNIGLDYYISAHGSISPVYLKVIDPSGKLVDKDNIIDGARYIEEDIDKDADPEDIIAFQKFNFGYYKVYVIPKEDAKPTDHYTIEVHSLA